MTYQSSVARLRARVVQGSKQGFRRGFLRLCNTCKAYVHVMLHACARRRASARMRESYTKALQVLQVLHSLKENGGFTPFHVSDLRKGAQGYGLFVQGLVLCRGFTK